MNKRKLVNAFLQAAEGSAKKAAAKNSPWFYYQPKEPRELNKKADK